MSPELALVDATLAERLRAELDRPTERVEPVLRNLRVVPSEEKAADVEHSPEPTASSDASDLIILVEDTSPAEVADDASYLLVPVEDEWTEPAILVEPPTASDGEDVEAAGDQPVLGASDLIVDPTEADTGDPTTWYPALPAPEDVGPDQLDATEAVLREIRDRLATPPSPGRRRRFRARFTVASGICTLCAIGVLATNAYFGVTQLPL